MEIDLKTPCTTTEEISSINKDCPLVVNGDFLILRLRENQRNAQ